VLLLDEPTAALGVKETARVEDLILRLKEAGVAIILVSHDLEQIMKLCDDMVVLRRGAQVGVYPKSDMSQAEIVSLIVGG
jgi:simple sugar transport system ATP-binding protein